MKHKLILTVALLCFSSLACHAAPGLDACSAIPPDQPCLADQPVNPCAQLLITLAPACDILWLPVTPPAPEYLAPVYDLRLEGCPVISCVDTRPGTHVLPITFHGWYGIPDPYPASDWRLHSAWHPSGRTL